MKGRGKEGGRNSREWRKKKGKKIGYKPGPVFQFANREKKRMKK